MDKTAYLKANAHGYTDINGVCKDIGKLTKVYHELRPAIETFTHNNGVQQSLINLRGTIPVFYRGQQYNIPIRMVVIDKHPSVAPFVFVTPTQTMFIRQGRHVDANGKVYLPYLSEWKRNRSDMKGLVDVMCTVFGNEPPVVSRSAVQNNRPAHPVQTRTPYNVTQTASNSYPAYPAMQSYMGMSQPNVQRPPTNMFVPPPYPAPNYSGSYPPQRPAYPSQPPAFSVQPPLPAPKQDVTNVAASPKEHEQLGYDVVLLSLRDACGDAIRRRTIDIDSELEMELNTLKRTEKELQNGNRRIEEIHSLMQRESTTVETTITELENKTQAIDAKIDNLENNSAVDPQDIIQPSTPIYKQIFNAYAREQALEDSIYHLNKALIRGTIDCDTFLRFVRSFSREQFEMKETVIKARTAARLRD